MEKVERLFDIEKQEQFPKDVLDGLNILLNNVLQDVTQSLTKITHIYPFGSRVYGTQSPESDWDFIVVADGKYFIGPKLFEQGELNVNIYHTEFFNYLLSQNVVWILQLAYYPSKFKILETTPLSDKFALKKTLLEENYFIGCEASLDKS
eukprot:TRINITY_DN7232_c0_g1_i1.p1 TRINITY_DN7232_c0_g1~~TRINITY_DN7232_c0_g1_i1.p1  ORF type:complete len:150 (-),score=33.39 TRINITY_DN7232_c0_g1_i1:330-779(-)